MALIYSGGLTSTSFTSGSTTQGWQAHLYIYGGHFVLGAAGTATQMGVYAASETGSINLKFGLYNSSGTLQVQSTGGPVTGTGSAWYDSGTFSTALTAGTYYVMVSADTNKVQYGYNSGGDGTYGTEDYATAMQSSETLTYPGDIGYLYGTRMDFAESAGGVSILPRPATKLYAMLMRRF